MWICSYLMNRSQYVCINDMNECHLWGTTRIYIGSSLTEVCKTVSKEMDKLCRWFQVNKLSLNIAKTNFMVFSNKKCENNNLVSINGMYINRVYVTKYLGVHIDCHLNWSEHINLIKT